MVVLVDSVVPSGTLIVNVVSITDTAGLTDTDVVTTPVIGWHGLAITKTAEPSPVAAGGLLTYTLEWEVVGNEPAPGVTISDTTPASTTFWAAIPPAASDPGVGGSGRCTHGHFEGANGRLYRQPGLRSGPSCHISPEWH
jgi:uncharacterized repeat protein (TIGR01451 family)